MTSLSAVVAGPLRPRPVSAATGGLAGPVALTRAPLAQGGSRRVATRVKGLVLRGPAGEHGPGSAARADEPATRAPATWWPGTASRRPAGSAHSPGSPGTPAEGASRWGSGPLAPAAARRTGGGPSGWATDAAPATASPLDGPGVRTGGGRAAGGLADGAPGLPAGYGGSFGSPGQPRAHTRGSPAPGGGPEPGISPPTRPVSIRPVDDRARRRTDAHRTPGRPGHDPAGRPRAWVSAADVTPPDADGRAAPRSAGPLTPAQSQPDRTGRTPGPGATAPARGPGDVTGADRAGSGGITARAAVSAPERATGPAAPGATGPAAPGAAGPGAAPGGGPSPSSPGIGTGGRGRLVPTGAALRPAPPAYPARPGPTRREPADAHAGGRPGGVSVEIGRVEIRTAAPARPPGPPAARPPRSHTIDPGPGFTGGW